jgi:hypothetical protein
LINRAGEKKPNLLIQLPISSEWSIMEFTGPDFPMEFDATLIDIGQGWGEWSALGFEDRRPK